MNIAVMVLVMEAVVIQVIMLMIPIPLLTTMYQATLVYFQVDTRKQVIIE